MESISAWTLVGLEGELGETERRWGANFSIFLTRGNADFEFYQLIDHPLEVEEMIE